MSLPARRIRKHDVPTSVRTVLQGLCAAEFIKPSRVVWLVSAWVSDTTLIDNRTGAYSALEPSWPEGPIRVVRYLTSLARRGTTVHVATNMSQHNDDLCERLEARREEGLPLRVHRQEHLHEKGLLTERFFLFGSMNFTHRGIHTETQTEAIELLVEPTRLAEERIHFAERWGGVVA